MNEISRKIEKEIITLYEDGLNIVSTEANNQRIRTTTNKDEKDKPYCSIHASYQSWYTKSLPIVKQLLPDRLREFQDQYRLERRDDKDLTVSTYTISDYLLGIHQTIHGEDVFNTYASFITRFQHQLLILHSAIDRLNSRLTDIEGILQSELFSHELEVAEDLQKKGHLRAAGALSGVSLETHLSHVCVNHKITINKKSPTISDFNEKLKADNVIDIPTWRHIQLLGDIRNICVHVKEREPTNDDISTLISGTKKILATLS